MSVAKGLRFAQEGKHARDRLIAFRPAGQIRCSNVGSERVQPTSTLRAVEGSSDDSLDRCCRCPLWAHYAKPKSVSTSLFPGCWPRLGPASQALGQSLETVERARNRAVD